MIYDWSLWLLPRFTVASPLLAALRTEPGLYEEALNHYYRQNLTYIDCGNYERFETLNSLSWRSIRCLEVDLL